MYTQMSYQVMDNYPNYEYDCVDHYHHRFNDFGFGNGNANANVNVDVNVDVNDTNSICSSTRYWSSDEAEVMRNMHGSGGSGSGGSESRLSCCAAVAPKTHCNLQWTTSLSTTAAMRQKKVINFKEQRRTQTINNAFADLRDCIPSIPADTKLSKIKTLKLAKLYIEYLLDILDQNQTENYRNDTKIYHSYSYQQNTSVVDNNNWLLSLMSSPSPSSSSSTNTIQDFSFEA